MADAFVNPAWHRNRTLRGRLRRRQRSTRTAFRGYLLFALQVRRYCYFCSLQLASVFPRWPSWIDLPSSSNSTLGEPRQVHRARRRRGFRKRQQATYVLRERKALFPYIRYIKGRARTNIRPSCLPSENSACQQVQCKSAWRISVVWQAWITSTFIGCGIPSPLRWPMRRGTSCSSRNYSGHASVAITLQPAAAGLGRKCWAGRRRVESAAPCVGDAACSDPLTGAELF